MNKFYFLLFVLFSFSSFRISGKEILVTEAEKIASAFLSKDLSSSSVKRIPQKQLLLAYTEHDDNMGALYYVFNHSNGFVVVSADDEVTPIIGYSDGGGFDMDSIPENMNFVEDLNGQGCLGFGGCINPNMSEGYEQGSFNIVVKEINGVAMNGKNPPESSNNSNGATNGNTTEDSDLIVGDSIDTTDTNNATTEESVNTLLISFIICSGVLLLAVVVAVVVIIILKKKNKVLSRANKTEE
jgi:hypothetical protein